MAKKSNTKTLAQRIEVFEKEVRKKAEDKYPEPMIVAFIRYWTEHNDNGVKFKMEKVKHKNAGIFSIGGRLSTWYINSRGKYDKNNDTNGQFKKLREEYGLE